MKPLFVLIAVCLLQLYCSVYAQCDGTADVVPVTDFGAFIPDLSDEVTIQNNFHTINNAVSSVGKIGGGSISLPEGTYYIGPNPDSANAAITINYDNITICGSGSDKTILRTNGTYKIINGKVKRGHGILINGTTNRSSPRKNIVLKNFQLDGQSGWTGNYKWPADPETGDGWDVSHKGIIPCWDKFCDSILMENIYVHHYMGEILYSGGFGLGTITIRNVRSENTNSSTLNVHGANMVVDGCTFGGPSRFWMELIARQNQGGYASNRAIFTNNRFENALVGPAIVMTQGDFKRYEYTFTNNSIENCPGVFGFYSGVGGPVNIYENDMTNSGVTLQVNYAGGATDFRNGNINFFNNIINKGTRLVHIGSYVENFHVYNNHFTGVSATDRGKATAVFYDGQPHNVTIEGNLIQDCRSPEQIGAITGEGTRPFFENNTYVNVELRNAQGTFNIYNLQNIVIPRYEKVRIMAHIPDYIVNLESLQYADSQELEVTGGSLKYPVLFKKGHSSYEISEDLVLTGTEVYYFRYNASAQKWIDVNIVTGNIDGKKTDLLASPNPFNEHTTLSFESENTDAEIFIFDLSGRIIETIPVHSHQQVQIGDGLRNGVYLIKWVNNGQVKLLKLIKTQ